MVVKPDYVNPQGQWGNRFWATKLSKVLSPDATPALKASAFPKPYFHAAMVGYLFAMVATLAMLLAFNHAQPLGQSAAQKPALCLDRLVMREFARIGGFVGHLSIPKRRA